MRQATYMRAALAAILLAAMAPLAQAQQPQVKTAQAVANAVRTDASRSVRDAREFLLQVHGTHSAAELEAVADALAEVAITSNDLRSVRSAVEVLGMAATDTAHTRYPGAVDALVRIAGEGNGMAAIQLRGLPHRAAAVANLRNVAANGHGAGATIAVRSLGSELGTEGLAVARELYLEGPVEDPVAQCDLERLARNHGWTDPTPEAEGVMRGNTVVVTEPVGGCYF